MTKKARYKSPSEVTTLTTQHNASLNTIDSLWSHSWYSTVMFCRLEQESPPLLPFGSISTPGGTRDPNEHPSVRPAGLPPHTAARAQSSAELPY